MAKQIERRVIGEPVQMRKTDAGVPILEGYAAVFNVETVVGGWFRELIEPGAFDDAIKSDDVRGLFNHDASAIISRTKNGTLELAEDAKGLRYVMTLNPNDPQAMSIAAKVERGDVDQSSFAFGIESDDDEAWDYSETKSGKLPLRRIKRVSPLWDVSAVTYAQYGDATSVSARAMEMAANVPPDPAEIEHQAALGRLDARKRRLQIAEAQG